LNIDYFEILDILKSTTNLIKNDFLPIFSIFLLPVFLKIWKVCKPTYANHKNLISKSINSYYLYSNISSDNMSSKSEYSKTKTIKAPRRFSNFFNPALERFNELEIEKQKEFKSSVDLFLRLYTFITNIENFYDTKIHKFFNYVKFFKKSITKRK
jgi:hypothetical protein